MRLSLHGQPEQLTLHRYKRRADSRSQAHIEDAVALPRALAVLGDRQRRQHSFARAQRPLDAAEELLTAGIVFACSRAKQTP